MSQRIKGSKIQIATMKNTAPVISLLLLCSCNNQGKRVEITKSIDDASIRESPFHRIYKNNKCPKRDVVCAPELLIERSGNKRDSVRGKVYYSNNYLSELAECNNLQHELFVNIRDSAYQPLYTGSKKSVDTLHFLFKYPTNSNINLKGQQRLIVSLRTSYTVPHNEGSRYDTVIQRPIYIKVK